MQSTMQVIFTRFFTRKIEARRLMERKETQQNKNLIEKLKQGLPAQLRFTKQVDEFLTYTCHRM